MIKKEYIPVVIIDGLEDEYIYHVYKNQLGKLEKYIDEIPDKFNLSNVMLTVLLVYNKEDVEFIPITFRPRQGGVNSINFKKIIGIGKQAVKDFSQIKKTMKKSKK